MKRRNPTVAAEATNTYKALFAAPLTAIEQYRRVAGEVEARRAGDKASGASFAEGLDIFEWMDLMAYPLEEQLVKITTSNEYYSLKDISKQGLEDAIVAS